MTRSTRRTRPVRVVGWASLAVAALVAVGCGADDPGDSGSSPTSGRAPGGTGVEAGTPPSVDLDQAAALDSPIALLPRPGDDHLWVAEREGTVRRLTVADDGSLQPDGDPVLDLRDQTTTDAERGLLGLAFSSHGDTLFVNHTDPNGNTRVAAYDIVDDRVDADSRRVLLAVAQPFPNHNGGNLVLGPDGMLWVGLGDGGAGDDPGNRAQDPDTLLGKMVRLDPEGGDPEIVISGLRNPWRYAFDTDGSLWIGDVGQGAIEEIDHLPADGIDGANLGWSGYEGSEPHLDGEGRRPADPVMPIYEYTHDDGNCAITGGFVYRGSAIPSLQGSFLFADYCKGQVRAVRQADDGTVTDMDLGVEVPQPISFGTDADGEAYVLSAGGAIVRLVPKAG